MLQGEHSAILLTFIKQSFVIKIFVLSSFEWPFYTCFTVHFEFLSLVFILSYCYLSYCNSVYVVMFINIYFESLHLLSL